MITDPRIRHVLAPNPSPWTGTGTCTWLVGDADLAVLDPGPDSTAHLAALLAAIGGTPVRAILVTHAHGDHSELAPALSAATGAPVLAMGDWQTGLDPVPARAGLGTDTAFRPDRTLADGETVRGADWALTALHTPGHMAHHLCFDTGATLFTGDHIMGWASTIVAAPEGDMDAYCASLRRCADLGPRRYLPGHGEPIADGPARALDLLARRQRREAEILGDLAAGPTTSDAIVARHYDGLIPALAIGARLTVESHLRALARRGVAVAEAGVWRLL